MKQTKNILIVDDDPDIGNMLKMVLDHNGYHTELSHHANQIEKTAGAIPFDLIILDMLIQGTNGTDVCRKLKNNSDLAPIPVLMISALPDARQTCLEAGAEEFISKPFELQEILSKIDQVIQKKTAK